MRKKYLLSILFLSIGISALAWGIFTAPRHSLETERQYHLIFDKEKYGNVFIEGSGFTEYQLCDFAWNPVATKKTGKNGKTAFRDIPEGLYRMRCKKSDKYVKLTVFIYVAEKSDVIFRDLQERGMG